MRSRRILRMDTKNTEAAEAEKSLLKQDKRKAMSLGDRIVLSELYNETEAEFKIEKCLGRGSSVICYRAYKSDPLGDIVGVLKEFYPYDDANHVEASYNVDRRNVSSDDKKSNQLYVGMNFTAENFINARDRYLIASNTVSDFRNNNSNQFERISEIKVYKGLSDGVSSIYIWNPFAMEIQSFDKTLAEITKETLENKNKLSNLIFILSVFSNLARGISDLHNNGYCHLDITPGNFGLKIIDGEVSDQISLFDINTFNSIFSANEDIGFMGTPGFRNPLFLSERKIRIKHDIFSIGAALFYALVISKNGNDAENTYFLHPDSELLKKGIDGIIINDDYYISRLEEIEGSVKSSLLFRDCEENENKEIVKGICGVLEKCLTEDPWMQYSQIDSFTKDIEDIKTKLIKWESLKAANRNSRNKAQLIANDKEALTGIDDALRELLCEHPLYDYAVPVSLSSTKCAVTEGKIKKGSNRKSSSGSIAEPAIEQTVNILICGAGRYAADFIDFASQLMQMKGYKARFSVLSDEPDEDKAAFLKKRPALPDYFQIDGKTADRVANDPYAYIDFHKVNFDTTLSESTDNQKRVLQRFFEENKADYRFVFCALHRDELNFNVADAARQVLSDSTTASDRVFSYVVFGDRDAEDKPVIDVDADISRYTEGGLYPVKLYGEYQKTARHRLLSQMAFNIHLLWKGTLSDVKEERERFEKDSYSKSSSLASALTIQYRLKSIGIELDYADPAGAAEKAFRQLDENKVAELAAYEHRRWNIEKITGGWTLLPESEYGILKTDTKDNESKRHTCLVPSVSRRGLLSDYWTADGKKNWNGQTTNEEEKVRDEEELKLLDPLDKMSVMLHRHFLKKKNEADGNRIREELAKLSIMIKGNSVLENVFGMLRDSVTALLTSNSSGLSEAEKSKINFFKYYKNRFLRLAGENKSAVDYESICKAVKSVCAELLGAVEACSYTDYKKKDEDIIRNIPFILTYSDKLKIAAPLEYEKAEPTKLFNNAAAALCLNPEEIYYVVPYKGERSAEGAHKELKEALCFITVLFRNHGIGTHINIVILASEKQIGDAKKLAQMLDGFLGNNGSAEALEYADDVNSALEAYLTSRCEGGDAFNAIEKRGNLFVAAERVTRNLPWFELKSEKQEFTCNSSSAFVSYLPFMPSLYADDLFIAKGISSNYKEPQIKDSAKLIWENIYKDELYTVAECERRKQLWNEFCSLVADNSRVPLFEICSKRSGEFRRFVYYFPREYKEALERFLVLFRSKALTESFEFRYENSYTVRLEISALESVDAVISGLLSSAGLFLSDNEKIVTEVNIRNICAYYDNLQVCDLSDSGDAFTSFMPYLETMAEHRIICGKTDRSFVCTSSMIKKLLSDNEYIFRLYVYYKLIETGFFDEVRADVSFAVGNSFEDRMDIVAVKGFRTFVMSCRTTDDEEKLKAANEKIASKASSHVINGRAVLITDVNEDDEQFLEDLEALLASAKNIFVCRREELFSIAGIESKDVGTTVAERLAGI